MPLPVGTASHPLHRLHTWQRRFPRTPLTRPSQRPPTRCAACILWSAGHEDAACCAGRRAGGDRKSTRLNSSHLVISYAVFCLKKKKKQKHGHTASQHNKRVL